MYVTINAYKTIPSMFTVIPKRHTQDLRPGLTFCGIPEGCRVNLYCISSRRPSYFSDHYIL